MRNKLQELILIPIRSLYWFTIFIFKDAYWCPTRFPYQMVIGSLHSNITDVTETIYHSGSIFVFGFFDFRFFSAFLLLSLFQIKFKCSCFWIMLWLFGVFFVIVLSVFRLTASDYQVRAIAVFPVFRLLTDFVCLLIYEFCLSLWKIARCSVILLLPLSLYAS